MKLTPEDIQKLMRSGVIKSIAPPLHPSRVDAILDAKTPEDRESHYSIPRTGKCKSCGHPAHEYSPGNFSVQCADCNRLDAEKRRAVRK